MQGKMSETEALIDFSNLQRRKDFYAKLAYGENSSLQKHISRLKRNLQSGNVEFPHDSYLRISVKYIIGNNCEATMCLLKQIRNCIRKKPAPGQNIRTRIACIKAVA